MKKKILGLCFLSVLCLNLSTTVFAEESQVVNSTEISETTSINRQMKALVPKQLRQVILNKL